MTDLDLFTIAPFLGGFIGLGVALVSIWQMIASMKRNQKLDMDASNLTSENRLKEYFNLKFEHVNEKMQDLKEDLSKIDATVSTKEQFFTSWIQRVEDEVDTNRHSEKTRKT